MVSTGHGRHMHAVSSLSLAKLDTMSDHSSVLHHQFDLPNAGSEETVRAQFDALGPWFTKYTINGVDYGGGNSYRSDSRMANFFRWHTVGGRVLELASFEGGHSLMLTDHPRVTEVMGLEGRDYLIRRAEFVAGLVGRTNIRYARCNFDTDRIDRFGQFDVVFTSGLLYHLEEPWALIAQMAHVAPAVFIATHYSSEETVERGGYKGKLWREGGYDDPLSGLVPNSFWMSLPSLITAVNRAGFKVAQLDHTLDFAGHPHVCLYAVR